MMKNLLLTISLFSLSLISAQDIYLHCGNIVDTESGKILKEKTIVVSGNKIKSIQNGFVNGSNDDETIDLKTKTVLLDL